MSARWRCVAAAQEWVGVGGMRQLSLGSSLEVASAFVTKEPLSSRFGRPRSWVAPLDCMGWSLT